MPLEEWKRITETEQNCSQRIAEAEARARRQIAEAERRGAAMLETNRVRLAAQEKERMKQAEEHGRQRGESIAGCAEKELQQQQRLAKQRLESAADWIVERIVKG